MQVSVESLAGLERKLTVTIPSSDINQAVEQKLKKLSPKIKLDGFRAGKVPQHIIKQRYEPSVRSEVVGDLIQKTYFDAIKEKDLKPAGYPNIEPVDQENKDGFSYEATIEVFPEIEITDFGKIAVEKLTSTIEAADVDNAIVKLQEQRATWDESEGPVADGDKVTIDYDAFLKKELIEDESRKDFVLTVGSGVMPEGFEDALIGQNTDATCEVKLKLAKDYANEKVQGKTVNYTATIKKIEKKTLPEVNEELLKGFGIKEGGIEAMKEEISSNLERELKYGIRNLLRKRVVEKLTEAHQFDVPAALIEDEAKRLRDQSLNYFKSFQQQAGNMNMPELPLDIFKADAEKQVRVGLLFAEIIKSNSIEVDESLVDERIADISGMYDDKEEAMQYIKSNKQQLDQIKAQVLDEQVVNLVLESAKIDEKAVSYDELVQTLQEEQN